MGTSKSQPHMVQRPGETWVEMHRREARYVLRRKSNGAYRWSNDDPHHPSTTFTKFATIGTAQACCIGCQIWAIDHYKMTDVEIVERRWNPTAKRWEEVGVVDRKGELIQPTKETKKLKLALLMEERYGPL